MYKVVAKKKGKAYAFGEFSDLKDAVDYYGKVPKTKKAKGFSKFAVFKENERIF